MGLGSAAVHHGSADPCHFGYGPRCDAAGSTSDAGARDSNPARVDRRQLNLLGRQLETGGDRRPFRYLNLDLA